MMNRKLTITFDKSSNGDLPAMVVSTETIGLFSNNMEVINIIVGDRAEELYNELTKKKIYKKGDAQNEQSNLNG